MTGCIQRVVLQYFTCTVSPPCCAATVAFSPSWLLSSPVALFASSPSRCHSRCLCRFLGRGPLFTCRLFSRKGGATTAFCALSLSKTTVTAAWRTTYLASHACSCKFTMLPATSSSRLGACNSDGWIASSSVCVHVTMRRFSCASQSRHPTASQRCTSSAHKDHAGAWADELALDITLLPWHSMAVPRWQVLLFPCTASSALVPLSLCLNDGLWWLMLTSHSED